MKKKNDFDATAMAEFLGMSTITVSCMLSCEIPATLTLEDIKALSSAYYNIPKDSPQKAICLQTWKMASLNLLKSVSSIVEMNEYSSSVCFYESEDFGAVYSKKWRELFDGALINATTLLEARVAYDNRPHPYVEEDCWIAWQKMVILADSLKEIESLWQATFIFQADPSKENKLAAKRWLEIALVEVERVSDLKGAFDLAYNLKSPVFLGQASREAFNKLETLSLQAIEKADNLEKFVAIFHFLSNTNAAANKLAELITARLQVAKTFSEAKAISDAVLLIRVEDNINFSSAIQVLKRKCIELATNTTQLKSLNCEYENVVYREKFCRLVKEEVLKATTPEELKAIYKNVEYDSAELKTLVLEKLSLFFGRKSD